jgi:hypothetical protein
LATGLVLLAGATLRAQEVAEAAPSAALGSALMAACRQAEAQFAPHLTADNAAVFRTLAPGARTALMKRFVLLDQPGQPRLSSDPQGRTVMRCETPGVTAEMRFGETRQRENLAFIPVEVPVGDFSSRRIEFGMVRESGGWKLISVGLLLLDLPTLARQWEQAEVEAREAAAIAALRKAASAIGTYRRAFGKLPETLAQLVPAPKEGISPEAAGLLDAELTAGKKGGYVFRYVILPAPGGGAEDGFELAAMPAEYGKTGYLSFFLDASGTLHGADKQGAVATSSDPRIESH